MLLTIICMIPKINLDVGGLGFVDHLSYFCLVVVCFHVRLFVDRKG